MEIIVQNIPMMAALILPVVLVLMVITNIIVEALKGLTCGKLPTNILAFVVAIAVTLVAFFAALLSWGLRTRAGTIAVP